MRTPNPYTADFRRFRELRFLDSFSVFKYTIKWFLICLIVGGLVGSASAGFLAALEWATNWRESNLWIIAFLPLAGVVIAALYHYLGKEVVKGNNQLIEEIQKPQKIVPLVMAPLVFAGTIITHLFGGSAGREGTAVQMGGAIADQFTSMLRLEDRDRRILLMCGISAGFASVFGTPLAGAVFALEVYIVGSLVYEAILPSFLCALIADWACRCWGVTHIAYHVDVVPSLDLLNLLFAIAGGILFGLAGRLFSNANHFCSQFFKHHISNVFLRPFAGGVIIAVFVWLWGSSEYIGLGIPGILSSFTTEQPFYAFLIKILLTAITLGSGFKGGEVTPLFFIGATLGSFLSGFIPLPLALFAAMGFTGVFAAAANTPLACIFMGLEMFGAPAGPYIAVACVLAYCFSGHTGIYHSQLIGNLKHDRSDTSQGKSLAEIRDQN